MRGRRKKPVVEKAFTLVEVEDFETVCKVCEAEFLDEADLKQHIAQMHLNEPNGKTICKLCCAVLSGPEEFVSHFIFKHLEESFFCYYCYRVFSDASELDQHEVKHCPVEDTSAVTCSQCHSIIINRQELQKHEYEQHATSDDGLVLYTYFSLLSSALNITIKTFIDSVCKKGTFSCCKCKYFSSKLSDYLDHLKSSKCKSIACDVCFKVYKGKHSMIKHILTRPQNHGLKRKIVQKGCLVCGNSFAAKDFHEHKKLCKIIKCLTCDQQFQSIQELTEHQKQEHDAKISLETCKFCKKQFVGTLCLEKHLKRVHKNTNLYKYNCSHCDYVFVHPKKLFAHFRSVHRDIQPYTCKICNESFKLRRNFTIHIKVKHSSVGFVEFDKNLHVIFTDKKSESPTVPEGNVNMDSTSDASDSDSNNATPAKKPRTNSTQAEQKKDISIKPKDNLITKLVAEEHRRTIGNEQTVDTVQIEIVRLESNGTGEDQTPLTKNINNEEHVSPNEEDSDDEPLSNVKKSLLKQRTQKSNLKKKWAVKDKKAKLTCKTCNKYCYTVQNYHHHMTLHEKKKMKRCIICNEYFKSKKALEHHTETSHSSSRLVETLKTVMEKRKKYQPQKTCESFKSVLEKRKRMKEFMTQNTATNKFRSTIRKVDCINDCTATITPMSDHGLSVKKFIENFKPEGDINISNSVTMKAVTAPLKKPIIKMRAFNPEPLPDTGKKLRFPEKFKDAPVSYMDTKISVKLVQQLVTKPSVVNMTYNERIPLVQNNEADDYCNMVADETDYTQYKSDAIPEVAQEVMLEDLDDIPKTRRLAQEIILPKIAQEHGEVRIGHLLPQEPFFKIVKVNQLLNNVSDEEPEPAKDVKLPDGTRLISVKNPYSHLIANEHLQKILEANKSKYYTPKTRNIENAIAKALNEVKPPRKRVQKKKKIEC